MPPIDLNRGVERRKHVSGIEVYMYFDDPGTYLSAHGTELPEAIAQEAGFPVDQLRKEKEKRERLAAAHAKIEEQYSATGVVAEVVAESKGWKLVHIGLSRHNVVDPDGNVLNPSPLTADVARALFNQFTTPKKPKPVSPATAA